MRPFQVRSRVLWVSHWYIAWSASPIKCSEMSSPGPAYITTLAASSLGTTVRTLNANQVSALLAARSALCGPSFSRPPLVCGTNPCSRYSSVSRWHSSPRSPTAPASGGPPPVSAFAFRDDPCWRTFARRGALSLRIGGLMAHAASDHREQIAGQRDASADARDTAADARDDTADERDLAADLRDTQADDREVSVSEREVDLTAFVDAALRRDALAEQRDREAERRDALAKARPHRSGAEDEICAAAADRAGSEVDRLHAGTDRDLSAGDRADLLDSHNLRAEVHEVAATARQDAALDRVQSEADRADAGTDRGAAAVDRSSAAAERLASAAPSRR